MKHLKFRIFCLQRSLVNKATSLVNFVLFFLPINEWETKWYSQTIWEKDHRCDHTYGIEGKLAMITMANLFLKKKYANHAEKRFGQCFDILPKSFHPYLNSKMGDCNALRAAESIEAGPYWASHARHYYKDALVFYTKAKNKKKIKLTLDELKKIEEKNLAFDKKAKEAGLTVIRF